MKTLVTGGAGFIGSHLVDKLIEEGHEVVVVDNLSTGKKENVNPKAKFVEMRIESSEIEGVLEKEKPEIVFHLAAQANVRKSVEDPRMDAETNTLGSLNLLQAFLKHGTGEKKFIFTSTGGAIYGEADVLPTPETYAEEPESPYGIAKFAVDKYLKFFNKVHGLPYVSLRLSNVYGPRQNAKGEAGVVAIFCEKILKSEPVIIYGNGEQTRDFVYVGDVVRAGLFATEKDVFGCFNIATGSETSVNEVFETIKDLSEAEVEADYAPANPGELQKSCLDNSLAKEKLGWEPKINFKEGIEKTVEWFKGSK